MFLYTLHCRRINAFVLLLFLLIIGNSSVYAGCEEAKSPDIEFKEISSKIIKLINNKQKEIKKDSDATREVIDGILRPKIDALKASKKVLGSYWDKITYAQKANFSKIFRIFLARQSSNAISLVLSDSNKKLHKDTIKLDKYRKLSKDTAIIKSRVYTNEEYVIVYKIHCVKSKWKIYDVVIGGISFIKQYTGEFKDKIARSGFNNLILQMKKMNNKMAPKQKNNDIH